jgi:hypothetical protein
VLESRMRSDVSGTLSVLRRPSAVEVSKSESCNRS